MCGLYTLKAPPNQILGTELEPYASNRLKVYPGENVPVLRRQDDRIQPSLMRWGFRPKWATKLKPQINARAEGIETKPMFKSSFASSRCLVPADGFYEPVEDSKPRRYYYFQRSDGRHFYFAGIWTRFSTTGENPYDTVAIITTAPNEVVSPIHGRMPVILDDESAPMWLNTDAPSNQRNALLQAPQGSVLKGWEVSGDLYKKGRSDPSCIDPVPIAHDLF